MRAYWTRFAKAGNPNAAGFPDWPTYDARTDQCFELGRAIGARRVAEGLPALERIMKLILAETPRGLP